MEAQQQKEQSTTIDFSSYHMPVELVDELIEHYGLDLED